MIVSALAVSCTDDELVKGGSKYNVVPDIPVTLQLKVQLSGSKIATRAAQDENTEKTIQNIYVMAFKPEKNTDGTENTSASPENWVLDNAKMFEVGMEGDQIAYDTSYDLDGAFPMTTGYRKIYAIGNPYSGSGTLTSADLEKISSLADLEKMESKLGDPYSIERMDFKMVGEAKHTGGYEYVTVADNGQGKGLIKEQYSLELNRVDARITFNITTQNGTQYTELKFIPESYRVMRIPGGTYILPQEKGAVTESNTWDSSAGGYADSNQQIDFETKTDGSSAFEFYMCENRQNPRKMIESSDGDADHTLYSFREKQKKEDVASPGENEPTVKNGAFEYAHENSTYVIISGTLTGKHGTQEMYAKVNYTVHLGATGNQKDNDWLNDETLVNNYDVERNTHYTYNVTIAGVDKIIVEVESEDGKDEQQPGAEGDVILTTGNYVTLDSHYSRYVMTLKKDEILRGLSWSISTPFQRGLKVFDVKNNPVTASAYLSPDGNITQANFGLSKNDLSLNDYKWVKFAINKECIKKGGDSSTFGPNEVIKYPGEQAYNGGDPSTPAPIAGGEYYTTGDYYQQVRLYDVNQLLNFLYYQATEVDNSSIFETEGDEEVVHITVFVDEYVYIYDPTKFYYRKPIGIDEGDIGNDDVVDLSLWKKVVNGSNRLLNICVEGSKYSADGQSSVSNSVYTISQNPVYTFYNPVGTGGDFESAWGVEASVETKFLPIVPAALNNNKSAFVSRFDNYKNSSNNGRSNMLNILKRGTDLRWDEVINTNISDIENILLPEYQSIWYACLMRNRDLNGDDIVQESEIRWYLASIDQLTDMFIGEDAIPTAELYQAEVNNDWSAGTLIDGARVHVASSTYYTGAPWNSEDTELPTNPYVIWGEEGVSKGSAAYSSTVSIINFSYRCVRNLGLRLSEREYMPGDYVTKGTSTYTATDGRTYSELLIDVSRMADACIRPPMAEGRVLPNHYERDIYGNNRPPLKLAILSNTDQATTDWTYPASRAVDWNDVSNETSGSICPVGYRIPNLRELALIYTTYPDFMSTIVEGNYYYVAKTGYSRADKEENPDEKRTFGYLVDKGNLVLYGGGGLVRCVRDATND